MFSDKRWMVLVLMIGALSAQVSNVDFATEVNPIFSSAGCTAGGCHGGGGLTLGSNATSNYNNIVNVPSSCGGLDYVEPGDPSASHLYKKIEGTQGCGSRMPQNNPGYFDANSSQLELIRVWIVEGALAESSTVALEGPDSQLPKTFALEQNFPNPFNPATTIRYHLPQAAHVTLTVYDVLGSKVAILVEGWQPAGTYSLLWDGTDQHGRLAGTGVYFYRLDAGFYTEMKKMILLK